MLETKDRVDALRYTCASYQQENIYILSSAECKYIPIFISAVARGGARAPQVFFPKK